MAPAAGEADMRAGSAPHGGDRTAVGRPGPRWVRLRASLPPSGIDVRDVAGALGDVTRGGGLSLSGWLLEHGTRLHAEELAIHRSGYQLKEADPHTWAIPRLTGRAKAAMVKIQADEYGGGEAVEMHASLFADAMRSLGLDPTYGAYVDQLPAVTLATTNLISMCGLHRRLRGALVGHHQHIAVDDLVHAFLESEPGQADEVLFGAQAIALVEQAFAATSSTRGPTTAAHCGTNIGSRR